MDPLLVESGLFGRGVVPIDTPQGIARFNQALEYFGVEPTKLTKITVDGAGWSQEIALERANARYMDHGNTIQTAIIASPDQERKPIFLHGYSYERRLMGLVFARSRLEVADATTSSCVCVTQDQNMLTHETVKDLLSLETVNVQFHVGGIAEQAAEQKRLAKIFLSDNSKDWFDPSLWAKLTESGKQNGNLLRRHLEIPDMKYTLLGNFWARTFGGVFVFLFGKDKIVVVEDEKRLPEVQPEKDEQHVAFALAERKQLIEYLRDEARLLDMNLLRYKKHDELIKELDDLELFLTVDAVSRAEPKCDFSSLSKSKRTDIVLANKELTSPALIPLKRLISALRDGKKELPRMTKELELLLLRPSDRASENATPLLWMLLQRVQDNPLNIMQLYRYDKERFFALFETWPDSKKKWAVNYIKPRYEAEMDRRLEAAQERSIADVHVA